MLSLEISSSCPTSFGLELWYRRRLGGHGHVVFFLRMNIKITHSLPTIIALASINNSIHQLIDTGGDAFTKLSNGPVINVPDQKINLENITGLIQPPLMKGAVELILARAWVWR
jgi:hypothetical protein